VHHEQEKYNNPYCIDNYVSNVLQYAEKYNMAGLIARHALFSESSTESTTFPVRATESTEPIFKAFGTEDKLRLKAWAVGHSCYGTRVFKSLKRELLKGELSGN